MNEPDHQVHQMLMINNQDEYKEYLCPDCGRRFKLIYPPNYKKIVLDDGDIEAEHYSGDIVVNASIKQ